MRISDWSSDVCSSDLLAWLARLAGCGTADPTSMERFKRTGHLIALSGGDAGAPNACFACHGLSGEGNGAGAPRLAGLDMGYMARQLEGYAAGLRLHPEMEAIARRLSAADRMAVSGYYSEMPLEDRKSTRLNSSH